MYIHIFCRLPVSLPVPLGGHLPNRLIGWPPCSLQTKSAGEEAGFPLFP